MKKLIFVLAILIAGMATNAQVLNLYTSTTVNDASGTFWDYADTLTNADTIGMVIRVKSDHVMDLCFQVVMDELSGAATGTITCLGSNDGVDFVDVSPTVSGTLTADEAEEAVVDDFNFSYCKLVVTIAGTQTSTLKTFYSFRKE